MSGERTMDALSDAVRAFVHDRAWGAYHDPKNLVMALAAEVGELASLLRWVPNSESDSYAQDPKYRQRLAHEIGDVGIIFLALCDRLQIDPHEVIEEKLRVNARNYPTHLSHGRAERPEAT